MKASRNLAVAVGVAAVISGLVAAQLAQARPTAARTKRRAPAASGCSLGANGNPVKHVIYLQFDNTHYRRDAAGVAVRPRADAAPPELPAEQRHAVHERPHDPDLAHGGRDPLEPHRPLPDRNGQTVTNSLRVLPAATARSASRRSFKYWTDQVDATFDPLPNMVTDGQKTTPAPWVPFTRAGCDVGGVGTANIELENTATNATGDMTRVFGAGSPEWNEAPQPPTTQQARADRLRRHRRPLRATRRRACARATPTRGRTPPRRAGRLHGLPGAVRRQVRRSGDHRAPAVRARHGRPADHRPGRQLRLPGLRRHARTQHARLRRADAGERRARHLRLHLGRARPARAEPRHRLVRRARRPGPARLHTRRS